MESEWSSQTKKPKKVVAKAKKPKKVHPKKYVCYHEGCKEEFPQWKLALDHMTNEHKIKDPKLKKSIVYLDAKGEPKAAPRGAPKVVAYPVRPSVASTQSVVRGASPVASTQSVVRGASPVASTQSVVRPMQVAGSESLAQITTEQCDTIKMRETPKVLATASGAASAEGHRGNDLGQFGPNWVRTWGASAQFPHLHHRMQSAMYGASRRVDQEFQYGNNAKNVTMGNPQQSSFDYGRMFRD